MRQNKKHVFLLTKAYIKTFFIKHLSFKTSRRTAKDFSQFFEIPKLPALHTALIHRIDVRLLRFFRSPLDGALRAAPQQVQGVGEGEDAQEQQRAVDRIVVVLEAAHDEQSDGKLEEEDEPSAALHQRVQGAEVGGGVADRDEGGGGGVEERPAGHLQQHRAVLRFRDFRQRDREHDDDEKIPYHESYRRRLHVGFLARQAPLD